MTARTIGQSSSLAVPSRVLGRPGVPAVLAAAGITAQICYPLLSGSALRAATVAAVGLLAAAAVAHAARSLGARAAVTLLACAGGLGLLAETLGVATGYPFGTYGYAGSLGVKVIGVPLVVPLAWTMLAYPCLLLGRRLAAVLAAVPSMPMRRRTPVVALLGGLTLASWDLFLDPQMVAEGHWTWRFPHPALPGVPGVPLTNYAGWVVVAVVMLAVLHRLLPDREVHEAVPATVLTWTWLGSTLGNLVFFDRPWVALYGGVAMGALVTPYLLALRRGRR